jgi:hypothetical protein
MRYGNMLFPGRQGELSACGLPAMILYESPVMSVIEGAGFHPLLSRPAGMGVIV